MIPNLQTMQKQRLKLYGEVLKQDYLTKKKQSKQQKEEKIKRDNMQLNQHIQNTKRFEATKKMQLKEINTALVSDNFQLTMLKNNASQQNYNNIPLPGKGFIKEMQQSDQARLSHLKQEYHQLIDQNSHNYSIKRGYSQKIKQIQRLQEQMHVNKVKQMQMDSLRNYEAIRQKHQQDMNLYEKHRQLIQENEQYRKEVEGFTNTKVDILDRLKRNEYFERKANNIALQDTIRMQMEESERRKSYEKAEYLKKGNDLQDSMFRSVLLKSPRYEKKAYQSELINQMNEDDQRKSRQNQRSKEKYQINSIFGGVHGKERVKMIEYIDKKLGLIDMSKSYLQNQSQPEEERPTASPPPFKLKEQRYENPEIQIKQRQVQTPKAIRGISQQRNRSETPKALPNLNKSVDISPPSDSPKKYFRSFDLIAMKPKFFGA